MRPDEQQTPGRVGTPQTKRSYVHTPPSRDPAYRQQEAAADIIRSQINAIYTSSGQAAPEEPATPQQQQPVPQPVARLEPATQPAPAPTPAPAAPKTTATELEATSPYERTHSKQTTIQADQWKAYHSAWQDYYKRYYEGYYTQQVKDTKRNLEIEAATEATKKPHGTQPEEATQPTGPLTKRQAMQELKDKLLSQVEKSAQKARKSRHFMPIVAALAVVVVFVFLQYNQILIANVKAYVTPGNIDPQNIIVDPASTVEVGPEARLIIPKINVDTPVFYDIPTDTASQNRAMENGVAHFAIPGANSHPGQIGNTVLSGHSSNDVFAAGDYKFIFMQLDKLEVGDTIYANYEGKRYTYTVTKKEEVAPTQVNKLIYDTDKPVMTLITCTPLGTALRRLLVTAEQVYPTTAKPAPEANSSESTQTAIPGQGQPTLLERLFGS